LYNFDEQNEGEISEELSINNEIHHLDLWEKKEKNSDMKKNIRNNIFQANSKLSYISFELE